MLATLKDVSQSIRKGDWAATIDLKDASHHVPFARVTEGSSGSGGKAEVFSSVGSHSFLLLGPSRRSACQLWLCAGKGDWIDSLFGQFPGVGSELEAVDFSHQYSLRHFRPDWIPAKLKEMPSATQKFEYLCLQWDSKELRLMLPADKITRVSSIRISIESPSEDGWNISRQLWTSNTSSCPSDTGEKGDRILCFCTEQRGQRVGKMVDGPSEGEGVDLEK